jgi:hypothetical protein
MSNSIAPQRGWNPLFIPSLMLRFGAHAMNRRDTMDLNSSTLVERRQACCLCSQFHHVRKSPLRPLRSPFLVHEAQI